MEPLFSNPKPIYFTDQFSGYIEITFHNVMKELL
jgi:hypothetical protein